MSHQRYSEKRLQDPFTVTLLFSEPFQFRLPDVIAAIDEEFPALQGSSGSVWSDLFGDKVFDTGQGAMGILSRDDWTDGKGVFFTSMPPGRLPGDHYQTAISRAFAFQGAQEAWNAHNSYLTFTYNSQHTDLASRFKAARLVTCVSAVLAADPTCVGVLFPSGDVFASPDAWRQAAAEAIVNRWPLMGWFSYEISRFAPREPGGVPETACGGIGMAAFNGHEVGFASAPVQPAYAVASVQSAMYLLLAGGNAFKDGDTVGVEGDDERLRIRFKAEGDGIQTDSWILLHPASGVDELAVFGERQTPPPPPGLENEIRPQEDFMDRLLGSPTRQDPALKH